MGAAVAIAATVVAAPEASARANAQVLLDGLNSPKGVAVLGSDVIVAQGAFGPPDTGPVPGPVLQYVTRGRDRGTAFPVTEPITLVDVAISPLDGTGWGLFAGGLLVHQLDDGSVVNVLDMVAYQEDDPDPVDQDNFPEESNAYGLTIAPNGDALVADAAGNDIVRVTPEGEAWTVARFDLEEVATDLTPIPGLPETLTAEAVPTSVAFGRDGDIYVGELKGFPFRPGSSNVWRIDADAVGAWCTVNGPSDCTIHADGLTAIQDIAFNSSGIRMYVYELAADGVLAFEAGFETGEFPPAVLLEVRQGRQTELAAGQLSQPGGVTVTANGNVYVTDGVFGNGRLLLIR